VLAARVFAALTKEGIPFVLIGGAALTAYGSTRVSLDTDLAIKSIDVDRVVDLAYRVGLQLVVGVDHEQHPRMATAPDLALAFIGRSRQGFMKFLSRELELDFVYDNPVPFMRLYAMSLEVSLEGTTVRLASLEHLKVMKVLSISARSDEEKIAMDRLDLQFIERKLRQTARRGSARKGG
jgi:hypothetical protein